VDVTHLDATSLGTPGDLLRQVFDQARAEDALLKVSQAFAAAMDGLAILRADETYVFLNEAHAKIYGYDRSEELLGKSWRTLYEPGEIQRFERDIMPRFLAEGRWRGEAVGRRRDGSRFPQELSLSAIPGGGLVCVVRDITEAREGAKLQSALYRIAETTSAAEHMDTFYAAMHGIVGELMEARNFYIALQDEETGLLSFPYFVDEADPPPAPRTPVRGLTEYVLRTGEPLLVDPCAIEELLTAGAIERVGAPCLDWLGVPLKRGENAFGVLAVQSYHEEVRFTPHHRELLTFVSQHVAAAIDRWRARDALRRSEERFRALSETAPCAIFIYQGNRFRYANPASLALTGYSLEETIGMNARHILDPEDQGLLRGRAAARQRGPDFRGHRELKIRRKDGEVRWVDYSAAPIEYQGRLATLGAAFDITERKRADERIKSLAYHDALTGLPNRLLFNDRLSLAVAQAHRAQQKLAVLFLDLDRFKAINDSLGHALGDRLLQETASRLSTCVREGDTVARIGGDEFVLLLPGIQRPVEVARVAEKVLDALREPRVVEGHELFVTATVGISLYPDDGQDAETLVKNADTALYRAKEQGRNRYQLFTPSMNAGALERLVLENGLRRALAQGELRVHYQPLLDLASGRIDGVEALLRWQDPERGLLVSASDFIGLAEMTGLIVPIGPFVLRTACAQVRAWQKRGHPDLRLAVNISARQLQQPDLVAQVSEALAETGLDGRFLEFEITETPVTQGNEVTRDTLERLKALGARLSIDDFGIGHCSLSTLRRLPVDAVKVDRTLVRNIISNPDDAGVASAVIAVAHTMQLRVFAEGVETEEQRAFLAALQCDRIQGHLFSEPVPPEACEAFLARHQA
jgi:diguanylate cyclase (GGDEF)-like protein/PAS domain S-box-containing protein